MKDIKHIERFCKRFGIGYDKLTDPRFIMEDAIKAGAVVCISLYSLKNKYGMVDLNFDSEGNYVGYNDENINSFFMVGQKIDE